MLEYLVPAKGRRVLLDALCVQGVRGSVSQLARRAGVTPQAARKEVEHMLALGLVVTEREGRDRVVRANSASPHVQPLRRLLEQLDRHPLRDPASAQHDRVRVWLGHYGAPLVLARVPTDAGRPPSLEHTLALGLQLAHEDATVALVLPVVLWRNRHSLDLGILSRLATKCEEAAALGLFLELTDELSGTATFAMAADLRDRRVRAMRHFFPADADDDLTRQLAEMQTPPVAKRWHFYMNLPLHSFESHFRKFVE